MFKILIALIFIAAGGTLAWLAITKEGFCIICEKQADSSSRANNSLQMTLINDLKDAAKNKELPPYWDQLTEVRYIYHSKRTQQVLNNSPIVSINKKGSKKLLVEFFDEPGNSEVLMVRYNVIDIASENTIGEMNRRLKIPSPPNSDVPLNKNKK